MKTIKRIFIFLLALITVVLIHYYLPQRDIVQVVKTGCRMGVPCDYPSLFENIVLSCLQDLEDDVTAGPRLP